jgi:hypothetical protein
MKHVPAMKVISQKSKYALLIDQLTDLAIEVGKLRREISEAIETQVQKSFGEKIAMIDGALTETILQKEVLISKGMITRDEINQKYAELKAKSQQ